LRERRWVSRYRRKLAYLRAAEKNRRHKVRDDAGITLGAIVSEIDGVSAQRLIAAEEPKQLAGLGLGARRAPQEDLALAWDSDLSPRHRVVLQPLKGHRRFLQSPLALIDPALFDALAPDSWAWPRLPTLAGMEEGAAALSLIEIGDELSPLGWADRLASGAALGPGHPEAAGQRKSGKPRQGNAVIRSILGAWAPAARGTPSVFGAKSGSLGVRRGHPKALVARAHQLRRTIFFVLTPRPPYRDAGFDDAAANVAKHAPRGIQALKRSGDWPQVVATA
jgi:hypothetical protein